MQAEVLFLALVSPSHEVAYMLAAYYVTLSTLTGGLIIHIDDLNPYMRPFRHISLIFYPYQAALLHFFNGNPNAKGPFSISMETVVAKLLHLNDPETVWGNLLASGLMYCGFTLLGLLSIKHLYKERC